MTGRLSVVATPIGNLEDITLRALRTLKECDVVYAEDTRVVSKLLARYEISKPLQRLDAATESKKAEEIIARLEAGEKVVLVSDAGTPAISDPGARLVAAVRAAGVAVEAIPGPSALTAALSIAGLDSDAFTFIGFLPHKKGRQTALKKIAQSEIPVVLYESPHRILKLLRELSDTGVKKVSIARELTKMHEEFLTGAPADLAADLEKRDAVRGEFVVISTPNQE
jgi:16S rRNA (cytidine1402-2'-O)-methyltransferase